MNTLATMQIGEQGRIIGFHAGANGYRQRLLAMGFTPGTLFTLLRVAPLGDPMVIQIRGYELCLRRQEAQQMRIVKLAKARVAV
jgi:ferrous iron transport protein A